MSNEIPAGEPQPYTPGLPVEEWQDAIGAWSERKKWWEGFDIDKARVDIAMLRETQEHANPERDDAPRADLDQFTNLYLASKLALVHSEVTEALEALRDGDMILRFDMSKGGKPEGFESELADIIIRVLDVGNALGMDLGATMADKMNFNERRPVKHGGRRL